MTCNKQPRPYVSYVYYLSISDGNRYASLDIDDPFPPVHCSGCLVHGKCALPNIFGINGFDVDLVVSRQSLTRTDSVRRPAALLTEDRVI